MPWLDGSLYDTNVAPFDITDRGLLLGDGLFDTSLVLGGRMVWREAHVARLAASAQVLGFTIDVARVDAAIDAVLAGVDHGALRITCTRGPGGRGLLPPAVPEPMLLASTTPLRADVLFAPVRLQVTEIRRNQSSPASRVKSLAYLDAVLASRAARAAGYEDALFLNTEDRVACTGIGNIFVLVEDRLMTPPLVEGVLAGIVRGTLLGTCGALGLGAAEVPLDLETLVGADAVFVTNSLRLLSPVTTIGNTKVGRDPRVEKIAAHLAALVRADARIDPREVIHLFDARDKWSNLVKN